jgi:hypothetical protein
MKIIIPVKTSDPITAPIIKPALLDAQEVVVVTAVPFT